LEKRSLLLLADANLPSLTSIVAGEVIRGSWWGHSAGQRIFEISELLDQDSDILSLKLVGSKVTFVHRRLWPEVISVACAREPWQLSVLSDPAVKLLDLIDREGDIRVDQIADWPFSAKEELPGRVAREIEANILAFSESVHTERGAHAKRLTRWERWARGTRFDFATRPPSEEARGTLEQYVAELNQRFGANAYLPWKARQPGRKKTRDAVVATRRA
jgi:hypothetical protein